MGGILGAAEGVFGGIEDVFTGGDFLRELMMNEFASLIDKETGSDMGRIAADALAPGAGLF